MSCDLALTSAEGGEADGFFLSSVLISGPLLRNFSDFFVAPSHTFKIFINDLLTALAKILLQDHSYRGHEAFGVELSGVRERSELQKYTQQHDTLHAL